MRVESFKIQLGLLVVKTNVESYMGFSHCVLGDRHIWGSLPRCQLEEYVPTRLTPWTKDASARLCTALRDPALGGFPPSRSSLSLFWVDLSPWHTLPLD
jgi:hypothetical protein